MAIRKKGLLVVYSLSFELGDFLRVFAFFVILNEITHFIHLVHCDYSKVSRSRTQHSNPAKVQNWTSRSEVEGTVAQKYSRLREIFCSFSLCFVSFSPVLLGINRDQMY